MTTQEFRSLVATFGDNPYEVDGVDLLAHSLQCAGMAIAAKTDDDIVLAAALHDIGRAPRMRERFPGPHEESGAEIVRPIAGDRAAWLVGSHVAAKRYLVASDPEYFATLSPVSVLTLAEQGGPYSQEEVERFREHPWAEYAVMLRRWDDAAKVPGAASPSIDDIATIYGRYLASRASVAD
jgi:gamma-butyrobetaine dioxygenase